MIPYVPEGHAEGNAEVVAFLERWLARAKLGGLNYVAGAFAEGPIHVYHDFAGCRGMEFAANWGLDVVKSRIMNAQQTLEPPTVDETAPANRFIWLATRGPACFDFFLWLIMAEMTRMRENAPAPLRIGFYWGKDGAKERILETAGRRQMYDNVIIPGVGFVGAVEDPTCIEHGRSMELYTAVHIVKACRRGEDVPLLTPSTEAIKAVSSISNKGPYLTITLREAAYSAHRNSNLDEWMKFAEYLDAQGERIIFVRDTKHAMDGVTGYETCPAASMDIDVRLALYEQARCNLFVPTGPWCLAVFGTRPWLCFNELNAMDPYPPNTEQWWQQYQGIAQGEQFPWSRPTQRIIWGRDTFKVMCEAWEQLEPLLNIRQAAE